MKKAFSYWQEPWQLYLHRNMNLSTLSIRLPTDIDIISSNMTLKVSLAMSGIMNGEVRLASVQKLLKYKVFKKTAVFQT